MSQDVWTAVDDYFDSLFIPRDPVLDKALEVSEAAGLPAIQVPPNLGKLLYILATIQDSRTVLEIGTLAGYSTIWLARALPDDGRVITLEADPKHADLARENIARAGLADKVDIRLGKALDTLPQIADEGLAPFDLIFIDADKPNNSAYLDWSLKLSRPGSLIIGDNVVRNGRVIDAHTTDPNVQGVRDFNAMLAAEPRLTTTALQTVGSKGYDGFAVALVTGQGRVQRNDRAKDGSYT